MSGEYREFIEACRENPLWETFIAEDGEKSIRQVRSTRILLALVKELEEQRDVLIKMFNRDDPDEDIRLRLIETMRSNRDRELDEIVRGEV